MLTLLLNSRRVEAAPPAGPPILASTGVVYRLMMPLCPMFGAPPPIALGGCSQLQAADAGVLIEIDPHIAGSGLLSLSGATCSLVVVYVGPTAMRGVLPLVVTTNRLKAVRVQQPGDFPRGGTYNVQLVAAIGGAVYRSPVQMIVVGAAL